MARTDTRNTAKYWTNPAVPGLSLLRADFTTHEYAPHTHDAHVIAVTEHGGSEFKSRGVIEQAERSALLVFNPAEPHSGWLGDSKRWNYRSFYVSGSAMDAVKSGLGVQEAPYFCTNVLRDKELISDFGTLHRLIEAEESPIAIQSHLLAAFGKLYRRHASTTFRNEKATCDQVLARRIIEYMRDSYAKEISLDDLASMFDATPSYIIRCFNSTVGLPPHAYLTQIRLAAARRLLKRGDKLAELAVAVGFYDQSALNKHFKRAYGITPSQYVAGAGDISAPEAKT